MEEQFERTALLIGAEGVKRLWNMRVAVFGIGGVGGYVCEALSRSGVGALDLIDSDRVCESNLNRQIIATRSTLGRYKTEVMRERISDINPHVKVTIHNCFFLPENADEFPFSEYDYVVDAVDTVSAKIALVMKAKECNVPIISSMGAGNKLDGSAFEVADLYSTSVCPLAKVMRRELKKRGIDKLKVVYSREEPVKFREDLEWREQRGNAQDPMRQSPKEMEIGKGLASEKGLRENGQEKRGRQRTTGSVAFVPAVAGLLLAGEVIKDLAASEEKNPALAIPDKAAAQAEQIAVVEENRNADLKAPFKYAGETGSARAFEDMETLKSAERHKFTETYKITEEQQIKYQELKEYLKNLGRVAVAFSGGVDSTFLLAAAREALGEDVVALTVRAPFISERESLEAEEFCKSRGIRQRIFYVEERDIAGFEKNPANRCYLCKRVLFERMLALAKKEGIEKVLEGSNLDDKSDYRPGMQAIRELGIESPLLAHRFAKADIRALSAHLGLPTWEKPSMACLASRFVCGEAITAEKLAMVEKGEQFLKDRGFHQFRVRIHETGVRDNAREQSEPGSRPGGPQDAADGVRRVAASSYMARIEVMPEELGRLLEEDERALIAEAMRGFGFAYVTVDLGGYRTGSMNPKFSTCTDA